MKRLNQALLALLLACGVYAEAQGKTDNRRPVARPVVADISVGLKHCLGEQDGASQAQSATEVVVWVNEDGDLIRTETNRVAATPALQENVSR
jgi:hypothetical protein